MHRDLKPDNIFLADEPSADPPFRVKILDFGISKIQTADTALTRDMAVMGTPGYMAPEQAMGHTNKLGPKADQFALGTIAYEMVTGQIAFHGQTLAEIVYKVVQATPPPIETIVDNVPEHRRDAITRAMAKAPEDRFDDIASFVEAFVSPGASSSPRPTSKPVAAAIGTEPTQLAMEPAATPATPSKVKRLAPWLAIGAGAAAFGIWQLAAAPSDDASAAETAVPVSEVTAADPSSTAAVGDTTETASDSVAAPMSPTVLRPPPKRAAAPATPNRTIRKLPPP